ncbi:GATA transcription factor 17-like isoform X2 [Momordica charantia]|uniref:GATA transcription factor 17-like isoform X2 n=2 Tax=Momordica charantia TaxID=3673 RepID=A0A6J1C5A4_MOMCH|nr:GATA transcription factor 17-like isoform X2 [Momordica charantia]
MAALAAAPPRVFPFYPYPLSSLSHRFRSVSIYLLSFTHDSAFSGFNFNFLNKAEMGMMDVLRRKNKERVEDDTKKYCVDCKTTKTPLWRGGPAGPKSLCNACGIRFRKRRVSTIGTNRGCDRKREKAHSHGGSTTAAMSATTSSSATAADAKSNNGGADGEEEEEDLGECGSLRMRLMMALGEEVVVQQNISKQRPPRKLGEEEQAAVSLMALSCGSVFA